MYHKYRGKKIGQQKWEPEELRFLHNNLSPSKTAHLDTRIAYVDFSIQNCKSPGYSKLEPIRSHYNEKR